MKIPFVSSICSFFQGNSRPVHEVQTPAKSYEDKLDEAIMAHPVYGWLCHSANTQPTKLTPVQRSFLKECGHVPRVKTPQEDLDDMWKTKMVEAEYNFG